jgi:hypothetical protein
MEELHGACEASVDIKRQKRFSSIYVEAETVVLRLLLCFASYAKLFPRISSITHRTLCRFFGFFLILVAAGTLAFVEEFHRAIPHRMPKSNTLPMMCNAGNQDGRENQRPCFAPFSPSQSHDDIPFRRFHAVKRKACFRNPRRYA